jgi:hypothetical protein
MRKLILKNTAKSRLKPTIFSVGVIWAVFLFCSILNLKVDYLFAALVLYHTYEFISLKKSKDKYVLDYGSYYLTFGQDALICGDEQTTYWHVPYSRLSHIGKVSLGRGTIFSSIKEEFYIYTNDNDSYIFPSVIGDFELKEIEEEINKIKFACVKIKAD